MSRTAVILWVVVCSVVRSDPDLSARMEALEARIERSEMRELQLEARAERAEQEVEQLKGRELLLEQEIEQLKGREFQLEQEIEQLKNKLTNQDSSSFFSVQFIADTSIPHLEILDFDDVIVNYGDDYILSGGIYIAPEDGYYMFTVVVREAGDTHCAGSIMRTLTADPEDAVMLCRGEIGNEPYQTGTCTVITELLAGDQVYVIADGYISDEGTIECQADGYTSFTGLQIKSGLE